MTQITECVGKIRAFDDVLKSEAAEIRDGLYHVHPGFIDFVRWPWSKKPNVFAFEPMEDDVIGEKQCGCEHRGRFGFFRFIEKCGLDDRPTDCEDEIRQDIFDFVQLILTYPQRVQGGVRARFEVPLTARWFFNPDDHVIGAQFSFAVTL